MRTEVNVLDYAMGCVLSMEYKDGRQRPVAFLSKSLNETERNYEIHDKEMLEGWKIGDIYQRAQSLNLRSEQTIKIWSIS